jgi:DNA invertase Pin-like site-specific DNA recombinase
MSSDRPSLSNGQDGGSAVIYLRVSTSRQLHTAANLDADGNSIATQRVETIRKARELGAQVEREFLEPGRSAQTIAKRSEFRKLLQYVDTHPQVRYVVIYMRSRIFRNFTDAAVTKRQLLEKGIRLVSAKEEFGVGYMADAMEAITDIMNEVQVRMSGEDIAIKMAHKVAQGGTVGRAKVGYLNVRKDFDGRLVNTIDIDPARAPLVAWAFEQYATGRYSTHDIGRMLEHRGLTTRPSPSMPAHPLNDHRISRMLRDPYYTGVIVYKGGCHAGRHEPLVSKSLFDEVQRIFKARNDEGTRDVRHRHYLRGRIACGECRQAGRPGRMVYSRNRGRGGTYEYLICVAHQRGRCSMPGIRIDLIEATLANLLASERIPTGDLDTDSARLLRRSGMLWKKAPQPIRRELLVALFQDIVIY